VSDERIAQMIRADEIDILVDLGLHASGNNLLVLARRPPAHWRRAPIIG